VFESASRGSLRIMGILGYMLSLLPLDRHETAHQQGFVKYFEDMAPEDLARHRFFGAEALHTVGDSSDPIARAVVGLAVICRRFG